MKVSIALDSKEVRTIIAIYLGISESSVIPNRYSFSVTDIDEEKLKEMIKKKDE